MLDSSEDDDEEEAVSEKKVVMSVKASIDVAEQMVSTQVRKGFADAQELLLATDGVERLVDRGKLPQTARQQCIGRDNVHGQ
ncbi:hypothetical protein ACEPAG_1543 [Sanghuangporus baumii]